MTTPGEFYETVLWLCQHHGASMTSAYRTPQRNCQVGGKARSRHLEGLAIDCALDVNTTANRLDLVRNAQAHGLGAEDEGDHVHLQVRRAPTRRSI